MENHYPFIKEYRRKVQSGQEIEPDETLDYYWALHRVHQHLSVKTKNPDLKERHLQRAQEYERRALIIEQEIYDHKDGALKHYRDHTHHPAFRQRGSKLEEKIPGQSK